ncbi:hypothetical protein CPB85DRAFT_1433727 [Mucidula mucida]|nr:hypothetical protein CPB85DRAFT_1433727 [Mucidula mucida]
MHPASYGSTGSLPLTKNNVLVQTKPSLRRKQVQKTTGVPDPTPAKPDMPFPFPGRTIRHVSVDPAVKSHSQGWCVPDPPSSLCPASTPPCPKYSRTPRLKTTVVVTGPVPPRAGAALPTFLAAEIELRRSERAARRAQCEYSPAVAVVPLLSSSLDAPLCYICPFHDACYDCCWFPV